MSPNIQSIKAKLVSLARKQQVPFEKLFTHFMLERIVPRLVHDPKLDNHLVFKGGFVCVRVYDSARFTVDIDTVLQGLDKETAIEKIKNCMAQQSHDHVWFKYESSTDLITQGEYGGHRLIYRGGLGDEIPNAGKYQSFHIDIGIGDPITPGPIQTELENILGSGNISWRVYPRETILAEKIHTLVVKGNLNSRSKDIYDVHLLLPKVNVDLLKKALRNTFSYRGDELPVDIAKVLSNLDQSALRIGWTRAVGPISGAKTFDQSLYEIIEFLKKESI